MNEEKIKKLIYWVSIGLTIILLIAVIIIMLLVILWTI